MVKELRNLNKNNQEKFINRVEKLKIKIDRENTELQLQKEKQKLESTFNQLQINYQKFKTNKYQFKISNPADFSIINKPNNSVFLSNHASNYHQCPRMLNTISVSKNPDAANTNGKATVAPKQKTSKITSFFKSLLFKDKTKQLVDISDYNSLNQTESSIINNDIHENNYEVQPFVPPQPPTINISNTRYLTVKDFHSKPNRDKGFSIISKCPNKDYSNIKGIVSINSPNVELIYDKKFKNKNKSKNLKIIKNNTRVTSNINEYKFVASNQEIIDRLNKMIKALHEITKQYNSKKTQQDLFNAKQRQMDKLLKDIEQIQEQKQEQQNDLKQIIDGKQELIDKYKEKAKSALNKKIKHYQGLKSTAIKMYNNNKRHQKELFDKTRVVANQNNNLKYKNQKLRNIIKGKELYNADPDKYIDQDGPEYYEDIGAEYYYNKTGQKHKFEEQQKLKDSKITKNYQNHYDKPLYYDEDDYHEQTGRSDYNKVDQQFKGPGWKDYKWE
jgi:hypothetical protein